MSLEDIVADAQNDALNKNGTLGAPWNETVDYRANGGASPGEIEAKVSHGGVEFHDFPEAHGLGRRTVVVIAKSDVPTVTPGSDLVWVTPREGGDRKQMVVQKILKSRGARWTLEVTQ